MTFYPRFTLLPFLMAWFVLAAAAMAAEGTDPAHPPSAPSEQSFWGGELKLSRLPAVLGHNLTSNLFSRGNLVPFLIGSAAALAIAPADQEISKSLRDHARGYGDAGDILGKVIPFSFAGGAFLTSRFTKNDHFRSFGYTLAQAYTTNFVLTEGIKIAAHRMRPDGSESDSFPSGHASSSFAIATVVTNYYGKKWGIPSYALAGLIAVSRIEKGSHWPSDAVAGAALGYISGRTAILGTKRELSGQKISRLMIVPAAGRDWRGVSVSLRY
jgi:membrane-associated phospholipid phosphatase